MLYSLTDGQLYEFRSFKLDCFIAVLIHGGSHRKFSHLPKSITGVVVSNIFFIFTWQNHPIWLAHIFQNGWEKTPTRFLYFHVPQKKVAENRGKFVSETNCEQKMWGIPCWLRFIDECFRLNPYVVLTEIPDDTLPKVIWGTPKSILAKLLYQTCNYVGNLWKIGATFRVFYRDSDVNNLIITLIT